MTAAVVGGARVVISADAAAFGREARTQIEGLGKQIGPVVESALQSMVPIAAKAGAATGEAFAQAASKAAMVTLRELGVESIGQLRAVAEAAVKSSAQQVAANDRVTTSAQRSTRARVSETDAAKAQADAEARLATIKGDLAGADTRLAVATLRNVAAQERAVAAHAEAGSAAQLQARNLARLATAEASAAAAQTRLTATQRESGGASAFFRSGTLGMVRDLGLLFGAVEAGKAILDIGHQAVDFQQKMLLIKTSAGASASEVRNMSAAVLTMAPQVATSPDKLADALYHVEQNGLRGQHALDALRIGAEGAKIGMADVEDTTNTMTIAMASGIHGVKNLQQAMGFMIATVGTGDMRLKDLNEALSGGILSVAKGFGVSLRDVAAVLATLGDNGIRGADAATALRQTMMGFAAPARGGVAALASVGLQFDSLRKDMESHGLVFAMNDLEKHMKAAGVTGGKVGAFITEAFGKRAGAGVGVLMGEIDRLNIKNDAALKGANTFASRWTATTHTAAFAFDALGARIQAAGVRFATAALPLATVVGGQLGAAVNDVIHLLGALGPTLGVAFKGAGALIEGAAFALHGITAALSFLSPVIKVVATAWAAMWLGRAAIVGVQAAIDAVMAIRVALNSTLVDVQRYGIGFGAAQRGAAAETAQASAIMEAEFAQVAASAQRAAATAAEAQLAAMQTYEQVSAAEIAAMEAAAETAQVTAAEMAAAADTAAAEVDAAGEAASAGWTGIAGPIGLAAGAVLALVTMFHHSASASKEATDAAKAYGDVLSKGGGQADFVDAITKQLNDNNLPQTLAKLNSALGKTAFTGKQFYSAIQNGNPALGTLRDRLEAVVKAGTSLAPQGRGFVEKLTPAAQAASKALKDLNAQYTGLSKAAKKDLLDTKTFAGVSSSIDKVSVATHVASQTARDYAGMLGIAVDKNGIAAVTAKTLAAAVNTVSDAYGKATSTGNDFLTALATFSKSSGTAADRAALIGATLKAANGDALSFAASMNAGATASHQLGADVASAAKSVGKSGVSVKTFIGSIVNLKKGTIDYSKAAAAPLINDLQSMQTAAMNAASGMYQHEMSTKGAKRASDDAYTTFQAMTSGALVAQARQLGLTDTQARALAKSYFGMPKNVKTLIEQQGANPVITVLNAIGKQLSFLTHQPWNPTLGVHDKTGPPLSAAEARLRHLNGLDAVATLTVVVNDQTKGLLGSTYNSQVPVFHAAGGSVVGPGSGTSDSIPARLSTGEHVLTASDVHKAGGQGAVYRMRRMIQSGALRFASGGSVTGSLASFLASMGLSRSGIAGVLGNAQIESSMNLNAWNRQENAHGLFQWEGGRWSALQALARRMHVGATSESAQFAMLRQELSHMPGLLRTLQSGGSAGSAAAAFDQIFERSSGSSRGARISAAQSFMSQLASGHLSSSGGGNFTVGGISFASARAAANAVTRAAQALAKDLPRFNGIIGKSAAAITSAENALTKDLTTLGATHRQLTTLHNDYVKIGRVAADRNRRAAKLGAPDRTQAPTAYQRLATAQSNYTDERASVTQAQLSGFDPFTAGQGYGGFSLGQSETALAGQASILGKRKGELAKLHREGISGALYKQLAEGGPAADSLLAALSGTSKSGALNYQKQFNQVQSLAGQVGTTAANSIDGQKLQAAKDTVAQLKRQIAADDARSRALIRSVDHVAATIRAGKHHAGGGWSRGPGTSLSDSILEWHSDGEFTVNARDAGRHAPLLEAINAGKSIGVGRAIRTTPATPAAPTLDLSELRDELAAMRNILSTLPAEMSGAVSAGMKGESTRAAYLGKAQPAGRRY